MRELEIIIHLNDERNIYCRILAESSTDDTLAQIDASVAMYNFEFCNQIVEGCAYEYLLENNYYLQDIGGGVVRSSRIKRNSGRIVPNTYVGKLIIPIINETTNEKVAELKLEVCSSKATYRSDYRFMLEEITNYSIDLLFQPGSPAIHEFTIDFDADSRTLYQRFAFIKSILDSTEFDESINRIFSNPVNNWCEDEKEIDIRHMTRFTSTTLKQIVSTQNRNLLPEKHSLKYYIPSIPLRIKSVVKKETLDTPENRFIKYALNSFLNLCNSIKVASTDNSQLNLEALALEEKLEHYLNYSLFKDVSTIHSIPLNSPVLQRKDGYREVFRVWIMMSFAAKLVWAAAEDIYGAGKKNVAVLYEYWVFFKLLNLISELFQIKTPNINKLIKPTLDDLALQLKQGVFIPLEGVYECSSRKLNVQLSYNRTFQGNKEYPTGGSWTRRFRPDYTLSIWPYGITAAEAEKEEIIVHIHFDSKYRLDKFIVDIEDKEDGEFNLIENYKREDLIKMHAYRDAIRRTEGAYIIYPGNKSFHTKGFHEIIPGLGAFALRPSNTDNGIDDLRIFLSGVLRHFLNRASQREKMSFKVYDTYKNSNINYLNHSIPEPSGVNRSLIPDETTVLVAYYKSPEHLEWILKNKLYNARTGSGRGALSIDANLTNASYLLLHTGNETNTNKILKLKNRPPKIYSKKDLENLLYPQPKHISYLIFELEEYIEKEFTHKEWNLSNLAKFETKRKPTYPFYITLTNLMQVMVER